MPFNGVPLCFNRALYDRRSHYAKMKLGSGGINNNNIALLFIYIAQNTLLYDLMRFT